MPLNRGQSFPGSLFQPREDIGGASGELGGLGGLAKNAMYERWWRKELEDFDRVAIPKMKDAVTKLGDLANDENFKDHGGAWAMMKSAVSAVQTEALKYPNNPYISVKSANMHKALSGSFQEMTRGLKDLQTTRTAREQERLAEAKRTQLMPQQIATSQMQQKVAEAELKQAERGKARITTYGPLRGHATAWSGAVEGSPRYKQAYKDETFDSANRAWESEKGQKYRDDMGVMAKKTDFMIDHYMSDEEEQALKKRHFKAAVDELGESPEISASFLNDMIRSSPVRQRVQEAKAPKILPLPLQPGSAALNITGWDDPNVGAGSAADFRPIMTDKHYNSLYGQVLTAYARLRAEPKSLGHKEAISQVFSGGAVDRAINSRINTSNKAGEATRQAYVREIQDLLDAEEENFFTESAERQRERLISEGRYGGIVSPIQNWADDYLDLGNLIPSVIEAGKEALFGKQLIPAAQEYLGKGASTNETVPPRIIESE